LPLLRESTRTTVSSASTTSWRKRKFTKNRTSSLVVLRESSDSLFLFRAVRFDQVINISAGTQMRKQCARMRLYVYRIGAFHHTYCNRV
jgi:hypothetical protein